MNFINNLENILISEDLTLKEALLILDSNGLQILALEDSNKRMTGIVTDGDIRRFILKNGSLDDSVSNIANRNFVKIREDELSNANSIFQNNEFNHLPVIDEKERLQTLIIREDKIEAIETSVVIVAGGKGTRLAPMTKIIPNAIIIEEEIRTNHLVMGSNSISKNKLLI